MGTGVILYQKGKGFQALPAVKMKILSEMSGLPHHRSHSPILPSHLSYLQQPFPGSLRQKQSEEMPVRFSPGVWGFDIFLEMAAAGKISEREGWENGFSDVEPFTSHSGSSY